VPTRLSGDKALPLERDLKLNETSVALRELYAVAKPTSNHRHPQGGVVIVSNIAPEGGRLVGDGVKFDIDKRSPAHGALYAIDTKNVLVCSATARPVLF